jgi:CheY-like chemotaxis protein/DNA-binding XRE family transcriptional regulator
MISVEQIRAARAMLNLGQKELALKAGISVATLNNIERQAHRNPKFSTLRAIQMALESDGIEFFTEAKGKQGICLTPKPDLFKTIPILIVDDNRHDRLTYKRWLDQMPERKFEIFEAANGKTGFDAFAAHKPACVILDFMMYGTDGFQVLAGIQEKAELMPPIILVTGMPSEAVEKKAKAQGVSAYLDKNELSKERFYGAIEHALCR